MHAVHRAIVTGINQTAARLQDELADEVGCNLVEVSAHAGARPEHAEWQGKIYSRSGKSEKYPDFRSSIGYGTGAGLCGWNCRHTFGANVEGSPRIWTDEKLAELNAPKYEYQGEQFTEYEARQKENYFDRQIQRWHREAEAMKAAGLDNSEAQEKVKAWERRKTGFVLNKSDIQSAVHTPLVVNTIDTADTSEKIIQLKKEKQRTEVVYLDVTKEYIESAKPGDGTVSADDIFNPKDHDDEIRIAKWLNSTFVGDIIVLGERKDRQTPDYLWREKLWDLKTPESTKNLSKRVQKGLSQIYENQGGIVCDIRKINGNRLQEIESIILGRMKTSLKGSVDVIILDKNTLVKVNRYKK